jgi:hypothetical protein
MDRLRDDQLHIGMKKYLRTLIYEETKVCFGSWFWRLQSKIRQLYIVGPLVSIEHYCGSTWWNKSFTSALGHRERLREPLESTISLKVMPQYP